MLLLVRLIDIDEKVASFKNIPNSIKTGVQNHNLFKTKKVKIDTLFMTKTAKTNNPLGPQIPI